MKHLNFRIIAILAFLLIQTSLFAQEPNVPKEKALNVLLRTNRVIGHAHRAVKMGKVYTGDLAKAVRHERLAKRLYLKGMYHKAIVHSKRARLLAIQAIKANNVKPTSDCSITPEEEKLVGQSPSDQDLDNELSKENVEDVKEQDLVNNNNLDLDVK